MSEKNLLRYDIVGSFLRPAELKEARAKFAAGEIDQAELKRVEDEEIRKLYQRKRPLASRWSLMGNSACLLYTSPSPRDS